MIAREYTPDTLIYVDNYSRGYSRVKKGDKFRYLNEEGHTLSNKKAITRIEELVIPPMWEDVWICPHPNGHIQATGKDAKGRKQYLYHTQWTEHLSQHKFDDLIIFARKLPLIREQVAKDLKRRKWDKKKVLALAVKLLDELYLRVGNQFYKNENGTYGLTTLRKKHMQEDKKHLVLKYKAKSGKIRQITVNHPTLRNLLKRCSELPGYELFKYKEGNKFIPINSRDVNQYLYAISDAHITAKNFRTWGGTVLAIKYEADALQIIESNPRKKLETTLIKLVADKLNNTVTVCRKYYIHPSILDAVTEKQIATIKLPRINGQNRWYSKEELVALSILNKTLK